MVGMVNTVRSRAVLGVASLMAAGALIPIQARAQTVPDLPPSVEPGRIEDEFRPGAQPQAEPRPDEEVPQFPAPAGADAVRFVLQSVAFDGSSVFAPADFEPLYADLLGQEVSLADIFDVANEATAFYRAQGYILSLVVVPEQEVADGTVRLQVIEGYVDSVTIDGEIAGSRELLDEIGRGIRGQQPLQADTLERYLLIADDLSGVTARGVLSASETTPGASDLTIVIEHDAIDAFAQVDNRGSAFIGPYVLTAGATANSVFGLYEGITFQYATVPNEVDELQFVSLSGRLPINSEGTEVTGGFSFSYSEPGFTLESFDLESTSTSGRFGISHPIIRSREENLSIGAEFEFRQSRTTLNGQTLTDDALRVLSANLSYDNVDDWLGVNLFEAEVAFGLPFFGSSEFGDPGLTRPEADGDFVRFTATATRVQRLMPGLALVGSITGQVANEPLLASEEFGFGGSQFGRGFDPSEITGDNGFATRLELQYSNRVDEPMLDDYQVYLFFDQGFTFNLDSDDANDDDENRASVGGGIRLNVIDEISVNFEVAGQVAGTSSSNDANSVGDREVRFLFGVTGRI